ncbi:MAG TPA: glycosyltransferase family 39 protein [Candidatus Fimivivens sp.]|nr:glycosyltransferase family 39 protein [Candidatus Fimivivens sp.]
MKPSFGSGSRSVASFLWIFAVIISTGVFLRTYHFHDWLAFRGDQVRDAVLVRDVVSGDALPPLFGPFMSFSGNGSHSEKRAFHIGPMYYHFQTASAMLFHTHPDALAYPDLLFSILSLPLFYAFMRLRFGKGLSLGLLALYAVSAYLIHYSRFAWSCNSIPFFVLLFLYSLTKFLKKDGNTWFWASVLGVAFSIGFQLHALTMILFSLTAFLAFLSSMKADTTAWRRWSVVLLVFLALNAGQIASEFRTGFQNSKTLLHSVGRDGARNGRSVAVLLKNDLECHFQANVLYVSSFGSSLERSNCTHDVYGVFSSRMPVSRGVKVALLSVLAFGALFSVFGYGLLFRSAWTERNAENPYFLGIVSLYVVLGFLLMLPLSTGKMNDLRYFSFVFFVPYLFLGLISESLSVHVSKKIVSVSVTVTLFILFLCSDLYGVATESAVLARKGATCLGSTTLGEIEPVADYLISRSLDRKTAYFGTDKSIPLVFGSLEYLLSEKGIRSVKIHQDGDRIPSGSEGYYVSCSPKRSADYPFRRFDSLYVYRVDGGAQQ